MGFYFTTTRISWRISPPAQIEPASSSNEPPTSLTLSLPGSDSGEVSDHRTGPDPTRTIHLQPLTASPGNESNEPTRPVQPQFQPFPANQTAAAVAQNGRGFGFRSAAETQFFKPEFLAVMQEMIKKEVRNYMSGIEFERNGNCMQGDAIMNAVVKRIGISQMEQ